MLRALLTASFLLTPALALARENYALLIGAAQYENLPEKFWLKGPANDIDIVARFLTENPTLPFEPDHILILGDSTAARDRPTLAAIRAAFAELAATVQPGDFVYLHFSGHGSQAPAADPSRELDGLDELFMPEDIGPWDDSVGAVQNALVDDEIGAMIDAIRAKGADVWAVFDSCHSGTVTRAAPTGDDDVVMRQVTPDALGVPEDALAAVERGLDTASTEGAPERPDAPVVVEETEGMGSLVAFFAAQTNETTPEKNMPKGQDGRRPQGVFTWTLFETLAERPGITYRQLGQEILRKYAVNNLARSTPMFEGDLDRVVLGAAGSDSVAQWPVGDDLSISAGQLHGLETGSALILLASPADGDDAALATLTVTKADAMTSSLSLPEGITLPKGAYARKVAAEVDYSLVVALPEGAAAEQVAEAIKLMTTQGLTGARLTFVAAGEDADLRLALPDDGSLWILPATGLADEHAPRIALDGKAPAQLAEALAENLTRMARAINLMKIGAATNGDLAVKAELRKARYDPASESVDETSRGLLDTANVPLLVPDDVVGLALENTTDGPVDFNILYIGSDYSITHMGNGRLLPGDKLSDDYVLVTDDAFGRDRMLVVLSPAASKTAVEDLAFLAQDAVDTMRGDAGSDLAELLGDAGFGETTRAAVSLKKKDKNAPGPMILQFEMDTVPGKP